MPFPATAAIQRAAPSPAAVEVGSILGGRFELQQFIASGGTANVYRARDLLATRYDSEHSTVCLKVLQRELVADEDLLVAVLHAAARMRSLRHPHIEQISELHKFEHDYVIVSEWLEGESLAKRLDQGKIVAADEMRRVLTGVADALEYAHKQGIAHGDIKPGNVIVTADGGVKLLDFGFFLSSKGAVSADPLAIPRGVTRIYASCELLEGERPSPSDDIYSVACMAYRMLAGELPYRPCDALGAESEGLTPARPHGLSRRQWRTLQRGLAFRRAVRPSSVAEFVAPFVGPPASRARALMAFVGLLILVAGLTSLKWRVGISVFPRPRGAGVPVALQTTVPTRETSASAAVATTTGAAFEPQLALLPSPVAAPSISDAAVPAKAMARPVIGFATRRIVASESAGFIKLKVRSVGTFRGSVHLSVSTRNGAARVNEDFVPPYDEITLSTRRPSAEVLVSLLSDTVREKAEDFRVVLGVAQGDAELGMGSVVVVLMDDD